MSKKLADLVLELQTAIQQVNSRPTDTQYESAVKAAVNAFNRKVGQKERAAISVVSGTASYSMPTDFLKFIRVEPVGYGDTMVSGNGLIPLGTLSQPERVTVRGTTLTIYPTPTYTTTRYVWYKAGHVLDSTNSYPYMTDEVADAVIVKAKAETIRLLSSDAAGDGWKYSIGDFMVDKSNQGKSYNQVIEGYEKEFERLVGAMQGPVGMQATYTAAEQALFN